MPDDARGHQRAPVEHQAHLLVRTLGPADGAQHLDRGRAKLPTARRFNGVRTGFQRNAWAKFLWLDIIRPLAHAQAHRGRGADDYLT